MDINFLTMESLILAQDERWRRASYMQVEREARACSCGKGFKNWPKKSKKISKKVLEIKNPLSYIIRVVSGPRRENRKAGS